MSLQLLDGKRFADMVLAGAVNLANHAKHVDALNVFPVPDGDTGTNMNLSMQSGAKEVQANIQAHIGKVGQSLAKGLLMGARGNSGVILSQLFRGFAKAVEAKAEITAQEFAAGLEAGVVTAYKAVMKPVEGTILTVAKDAAKKAVEIAKKETNIVELLEQTLVEARASLNRTPDLLPVLKEVGVVDSGGAGLVYVYDGMLKSLKGETIEQKQAVTESFDEFEHVQGDVSIADLEFGYCTEFMVRFEDGKKAFDEQAFRQELSEFGDSLLVISDDELVKVHIHAEEPGVVLNLGQQYGSFLKIKVENMREQHAAIVNHEEVVQQEAKPAVKRERQPFGVVTVAMGTGIEKLFTSIGATVVIEGGQTMNPSTEDILTAVEEANADVVFVMPNNKNIILAAEQAASVAEGRIVVIPTKTVPQGMAALLAFNPGGDREGNEAAMKDALTTVKSGQVTFAVRDTQLDGVDIRKDDFMGLLEGKIVIAKDDKLAVAKTLLNEMVDEDSSIVTILQGEDATDEETEQLAAYLQEQYEDVEVEVHLGAQPLYSFIFSVE